MGEKMQGFLRGLLIDLERRATALEERVEAIDTDALWDRYFMAAPRPRTLSERQYSEPSSFQRVSG